MSIAFKIMKKPRLIQYIQRFSNVHFTSWPGGYRQRKLGILYDFFKMSVAFLNQIDVAYWLDFGTLLGYYRENDIMPHDVDIDFGAHVRYYKTIKASAHLLPETIKMIDTSYKHPGPKLYLSYKGFDCDIYFYDEQDDFLVPGLKTTYFNELQPIPKALVFPIQRNVFLDQSVPIPSKTKEYLEFIYGYTGKNSKRDSKTGYWVEKGKN